MGITTIREPTQTYYFLSLFLISMTATSAFMMEQSPNCVYQVRSSSLPPYYRDNLMVECKVRSGLCGTNSMNINQLWRRAANPVAKVWLLHTTSDWWRIRILQGPKVSNHSLVATHPALLTSGLKSLTRTRFNSELFSEPFSKYFWLCFVRKPISVGLDTPHWIAFWSGMF